MLPLTAIRNKINISQLSMFNIPNMFTAANMMSGFLAILLALIGRIDLAPLAIFAGAIFDFLDGFLARKMGVAGPMGKQLDSLADMVTFGVAPGIIMLVIMSMNVQQFLEGGRHFELIAFDFVEYIYLLTSGEINYAVPFFALLIPFFSIFRLAKFNVDLRQTDRFIGLPTPANTLFFMTFPLVLAYGNVEYTETIATIFKPEFLATLCLVMSILLVAEIPLFALKFAHFKWKGNEIRCLFLLISAVLIPMFATWSIALIVFLYLILSLVENLINKKNTNEI